MPDIIPPDPFMPSSTAQPPVTVGGGGAPGSLFAKLRLLLAGAGIFWVVGAAIGFAGVSGLSYYLISHHKQSPKAVTTAPPKTVAKADKSTPKTDVQVAREAPQPTQPPAKTPSKSIAGSAAPSSDSTGGSTDDGSAGGGGSTGGSSNVPNPLKIMPLGDSLTQGGVNGNLPGSYDPDTVNGYRLALLNNLSSDYTVDYVGSVQYGNSSLADQDENGFSGACIKYSPCGGGTLYPQTAGWITAEHPGLVIMQGGGNDFSDPTMTEAKVETYMEDWISLVWATDPNIKIIVSGAPQWYPNYETSLQNYVNSLQAAGKAIRFVPYGATVETNDGTHPSVSGYVTWANELTSKVRELFPL